MRYKHVLYWGGLRGAISLALALSLPASLGDQGDLLRVMAFGVVLFTLSVQGLSMKPLINRMGLLQKSPAQEEYEGLNARAVMSRTAYNQLKSMHKSGLLSRPIWKLLSDPLETHTDNLVNSASKTMRSHPEVEENELDSAIKEVLNSERAALQRLLRDGKISEETFSDLAQEIDAAITDEQSKFIRYIKNYALGDIEELMTVVIQDSDLEKFTDLLEPAGYPITHIASTGGFLGRKNATLLIGIPPGKQSEIKSLLDSANDADINLGTESDSQERKESYGIATIFSIAIERYQEL
jgi:NhaP-type Na+/H+ or K+/H+ antiporter